MKTFILHVGYSVKASYYDDWMDAFQRHEQLDTKVFNLFRTSECRALEQQIADADWIVLLHSTNADGLEDIEGISAALQSRRCPLTVFMGNEFNTPWLPFARRREWLSSIRADVIATQLLQETGAWLYEGTGARVISVPHALNPNSFAWREPRPARTIDIGTRSFPYPVYLGNSLRNDLFEHVAERAPLHGLKIDISTDARFDRVGWAAFLNSCRYTVATEAGASHLDRTDALYEEIQTFMRERRKAPAISPSNPMRRLVRHLPWNFREQIHRVLKVVGIVHEAIDDDPVLRKDVMDRFFVNRPPSEHYGGCVSSRHFDAIGCGTVQILVEGRYNDLFQPNVHYVPVKPDFSNLDEVLDKTRDPGFGDNIAKEALAQALDRHTHRHRIDSVLDQVFGSSATPASAPGA